MKGIYSLKINNKRYVGKDSKIESNKRLKEHLSMLKNSTHYNYKLQKAFDDYVDVEYEVHFKANYITLYQLEILEIYYIEQLASYTDGYNLTTGGSGGNGMKYTKSQLEDKSKRVRGELNPQSKLSDEQFYEIVDMLKLNYTNKQIADKYGLHDRYVSLIRHKKRYTHLFEGLDYEPKKSNAQIRKITYSQFESIVKMLDSESNADIAEIFKVDASIISNIRNKKLYKRYWNDYLSN